MITASSFFRPRLGLIDGDDLRDANAFQFVRDDDANGLRVVEHREQRGGVVAASLGVHHCDLG